MKITEFELNDMLERAAKKGVEEYKKQEAKEKKKCKYHNTFALMKCYRDAIFHVKNAVSEAEQLELDSRDLDDEQRMTYLRSVRKTKFKTMLMLDHIDKAVEEIEKRRQAAGRELEYRAFELYFMQGLSYEEIAEELETGKNTPRRWINSIIQDLSTLLWGIEDE